MAHMTDAQAELWYEAALDHQKRAETKDTRSPVERADKMKELADKMKKIKLPPKPTKPPAS